MDNAAAQTPSPKRVRVPKFSLRSLLVLLTLACVLVAWAAARYQSARRAITQRNDLLTAVIDARLAPIDGLPVAGAGAGGLFAKPRAQIDEFFRVGGGWTGGAVWNLFASGSSSGTSTVSDSYDFTPAVDPLGADGVRDKLFSHFSDRLQSAGLANPSTLLTGGGTTSSGRYVWTVGKNDLVLILDIRVDQPSRHAEVQLLFIESQDIGLW